MYADPIAPAAVSHQEESLDSPGCSGGSSYDYQPVSEITGEELAGVIVNWLALFSAG